MLRLETKYNPDRDPRHGSYDNKIHEILTHFPTGHYISLVSAYSPISVFDRMGSFFIKNVTTQTMLFEYDGSVPFRNVHDMIARCNNDPVIMHVKDNKQIQFDLALITNDQIELHLSPGAAWCLGFKELSYTFPPDGQLVAPLIGEVSNPPVLLEYLQIICRNVRGTSDSNMTMPSCLGIMHITDNFTLTNPHIAVNHRINEGRVIDIEILDQDNQPFHWAPVYLELFVTEKAEHEKKRAFFRLEKSGVVHLHAPIKLISIPELFFSLPLFVFEFAAKTSFSIHCANLNKTFSITPSQDPFFLALRGKAITKNAMLSIFTYLNNSFLKQYNGPAKPDYLIKVELKGDTLVINTTATRFVFEKTLFITWGLQESGSFVTKPTTPTAITLPPHLWYNNDTRIHLYCKEFHNRYPVAVARRFGSLFRIINRNFWTWHEFLKPTNELHFRGDLVIVQQDGSISNKPLPDAWTDLVLFQLFYK